MATAPRIREATPSELFADRLEQEAKLASATNPVLAADYRRQAALLREMSTLNSSEGLTFHTGKSTIH